MTTEALQDRFLPGNRCFGCGPANPDGLHLRSYEDGDDLVAEWTPEERFQGPPGVVNGGVMAIPMDCHGTWAAMRAFGATQGGEPAAAVTAGYSMRLIAPAPIGHRIVLRARVLDVGERKAKVHVTATADGVEVAAFDGTFVRVDASRFDANTG